MGLEPAGLGARDTLRLEKAYPLYGHELDDTTTPLEAGLEWVTKLAKGPFVGREVLLKQKEEGIRRKLVGLELLEPGIARSEYRSIQEWKIHRSRDEWHEISHSRQSHSPRLCDHRGSCAGQHR